MPKNPNRMNASEWANFAIFVAACVWALPAAWRGDWAPMALLAVLTQTK